MSVPSAASFAGLAIPDITEILEEGTHVAYQTEHGSDETAEQMPPFSFALDTSTLIKLSRLGKIPKPETEFREFEVTGVF